MRAGSPQDDRPTFLLERFDWAAPDRLEVAGTFSGVPGWSVADPVLTVAGEDGEHRLPAVDQNGAGADDGRWTAAFGWLEAPVAFERAQLEFGAGLSVSLPAPGDLPDGPLPVEVAGDGPVEAPAPVSEGDVEGAVHRLTQEAQQLERTLAAATDARARELAALRRRVAELEPSGAELAAARAQLEQMAGELANARDERDDAVRAAEEARHEADALRRALADARGGAQELLDRIGRIADPPAGGR